MAIRSKKHYDHGYLADWFYGCRTLEAKQEYQQLSWGCYKAFNIYDYSQSAISVGCQNDIKLIAMVKAKGGYIYVSGGFEF